MIENNVTLKNHPIVGDYVICKLSYQMFKRQIELDKFFKENIGQITEIQEVLNNNGYHDYFRYLIRFKNIPHILFDENLFRKGNINRRDRNLPLPIIGIGDVSFEVNKKNKQIIYWSKNIDDLKILI